MIEQLIVFRAQKEDLHVLHNNLILSTGDKRNKNQHAASVLNIWFVAVLSWLQLRYYIVCEHSSFHCGKIQIQNSMVGRKVVKTTWAGTSLNDKCNFNISNNPTLWEKVAIITEILQCVNFWLYSDEFQNQNLIIRGKW